MNRGTSKRDTEYVRFECRISRIMQKGVHLAADKRKRHLEPPHFEKNPVNKINRTLLRQGMSLFEVPRFKRPQT